MLLAAAATLIDPSQPFPGLAALVPIGGGALLIVGGIRSSFVTNVLSLPPVRYLGRVSYPLYLWHWPVIVLSEEIWGRMAVTYVAAPFASLILAIATHHLIEEPLRGRVPVRVAFVELRDGLRGRSPHRYRELFDGLMATATVLVLLLVLAVLEPPVGGGAAERSAFGANAATSSTVVLPTTATQAERQLAAQLHTAADATSWAHMSPSLQELPAAAAPEWIQDNCLSVNADTAGRCVFGAKPARHHAALMGDSIALSYLPGLRAAESTDVVCDGFDGVRVMRS